METWLAGLIGGVLDERSRLSIPGKEPDIVGPFGVSFSVPLTIGLSVVCT